MSNRVQAHCIKCTSCKKVDSHWCVCGGGMLVVNGFRWKCRDGTNQYDDLAQPLLHR